MSATTIVKIVCNVTLTGPFGLGKTPLKMKCYER